WPSMPPSRSPPPGEPPSPIMPPSGSGAEPGAGASFSPPSTSSGGSGFGLGSRGAMSGLLFVFVAHNVQGPGGDPLKLGPAGQGLLAAVGDPQLLGPQIGDGGGQLVPVGMIGQDQGQLD